MTLAPAAQNIFTVAAPIPREPPVIRATLPATERCTPFWEFAIRGARSLRFQPKNPSAIGKPRPSTALERSFHHHRDNGRRLHSFWQSHSCPSERPSI